MKRFLCLAMLGFVFSLSTAAAKADQAVFTAVLLGANETPNPVNTPGTGFATVTIDGNLMRVQVTFSGLLGNTTASHIHCCGPLGTTQGVATTTPTFPGFPLGVTSGTYDQTFNMTLATSFNPVFVTNH